MTLPFSPVVHIGAAVLAAALLLAYALRADRTPRHRKPPN